MPFPVSSLWFMLMDQDVSSQLLFQLHACLLAAKLSTTRSKVLTLRNCKIQISSFFCKLPWWWYFITAIEKSVTSLSLNGFETCSIGVTHIWYWETSQKDTVGNNLLLLFCWVDIASNYLINTCIFAHAQMLLSSLIAKVSFSNERWWMQRLQLSKVLRINDGRKLSSK